MPDLPEGISAFSGIRSRILLLRSSWRFRWVEGVEHDADGGPEPYAARAVAPPPCPDRRKTGTGQGAGREDGTQAKTDPPQQREAIKRRDTKGEPVREITRTYNGRTARFHGLRHEKPPLLQSACCHEVASARTCNEKDMQ